MDNSNQARYPEEDLAENLRKRLNDEVASRLEATVVSLTLMGVNSYCEAKRGPRACTIYCFSIAGPQYLARFEEKPGTAHCGRTFIEVEAIGAVGAWLEGGSPADVCSRFPFIDRQRRTLRQLRDNLISAEPELASADSELKSSDWGGDSCNLWFRTGTRACEVYYYGYNHVPDCQFQWDQCVQFGVQLNEPPNSHVGTQDEFLKALHSGKLASWKMYEAVDAKRSILLARLMKRWLCDQLKPSDIQIEYPWIVLSEIASWYEQGRGIEGEFIASWRSVKDFYQTDQQPVKSQVVRFLNHLCDLGYDRTLRAGTSLYTLILSRARRHGLRHRSLNEPYDSCKHDPYIAFRFGGLRFNPEITAGQMEVSCYLIDCETTFTYPSIELTAELKSLLDRLQAIPIVSSKQ